MKKTKITLIAFVFSITLPALMLTACFSENAKEEEIDGALKVLNKAEASAEESSENIPQEDLHNTYIEPKTMGYDSASPEDCTVNASFTIKDFDLEEGSLSFSVYEEEIYDAVEVSLMQIGDTLKINGRELIVESIQDVNGDLKVNGGIDEGGAELLAGSGGTYRARSLEDAPAYLETGRSTLPISESLTISDGYKNASSPETATFEELEDYLDGLDGAADSFDYLTTTVQVAGGKVINITRRG